jgi:hypothetical protein
MVQDRRGYAAIVLNGNHRRNTVPANIAAFSFTKVWHDVIILRRSSKQWRPNKIQAIGSEVMAIDERLQLISNNAERLGIIFTRCLHLGARSSSM